MSLNRHLIVLILSADTLSYIHIFYGEETNRVPMHFGLLFNLKAYQASTLYPQRMMTHPFKQNQNTKTSLTHVLWKLVDYNGKETSRQVDIITESNRSSSRGMELLCGLLGQKRSTVMAGNEDSMYHFREIHMYQERRIVCHMEGPSRLRSLVAHSYSRRLFHQGRIPNHMLVLKTTSK